MKLVSGTSPSARRGWEPGAVPARTTLASIAAAAMLVALKLVTGLITGSLGLISAGVESSGDVLAATLTFFVVRVGVRPADRGHPYGHRRAENLGALGEAGLLAIGGLFVSIEAISRLAGGGAKPDTGWYVFAVIAVALSVDLSRTLVSFRAARQFGSAALSSNAFHFAADMAGSVAVLIGLVAVRAGFAQGDAIAALVVAALVFTAASRLINTNANALMDTASSEASDAAEQAILALAPDVELRRLRLRESAGRYFADAVVTVPPGIAVIEGHQAADQVEAAIADALPGSDVVVHVEPRRRGLDLRSRVLAAALSEPLVHEAHDIAILEGDGRIYVSLHLKLPADINLREAHDVAERVELAIRDQAGVFDAQTHLEPLELPLLIAGPPPARREIREIKELIRRHAVGEVRGVRVLPTGSGRILFLTVRVGETVSLTDAHRIASELEELLRAELPEIADVVVHTEP